MQILNSSTNGYCVVMHDDVACDKNIGALQATHSKRQTEDPGLRQASRPWPRLETRTRGPGLFVSIQAKQLIWLRVS